MSTSEYENLADEWVMSQPRKSLGSFSGDSFLVCCLHALYLAKTSGETDAKVIAKLRSDVEGEYSRVRYEGWYKDGIVPHISEMLLWWSRADLPYYDDVFEIAVENYESGSRESISARLALLGSIMSFPEGISYFELGITDIDTVRRCVAEGIDLSIAADLVAGAR